MKIILSSLFVLLIHGSLLASEQLKVTAGWFWPAELKEIPAQVEFAKSLGFNAIICCSNTGEEEFIKECNKKGIMPVKILEPLSRKYGARLQEISADDKSHDVKHKLHQSGGEPADGQIDILKKKLLCPADTNIVRNVMRDVKESIKQGYQGVCWDFIGYRNLRSCECAVCKERSGGMNVDKDAFYEKQLVSLYNQLQQEVKALDSKIVTMCHIHPVYTPNLFYASEIDIDYGAVTCSWFFTPHWKKGKVKKYLKRVYGSSSCMPMVGYYQSGPLEQHAKSEKQIDTEFKLLQKYKGSSIMICELGSIYGNEYLIEKLQKLLK
ncbi:MAG: hypothetical protein KAI74_05820 [Kiritimatiellae bacterium]|nr:hypothetical protein [Kiritimatiellia bacterium]